MARTLTYKDVSDLIAGDQLQLDYQEEVFHGLKSEIEILQKNAECLDRFFDYAITENGGERMSHHAKCFLHSYMAHVAGKVITIEGGFLKRAWRKVLKYLFKSDAFYVKNSICQLDVVEIVKLPPNAPVQIFAYISVVDEFAKKGIALVSNSFIPAKDLSKGILVCATKKNVIVPDFSKILEVNFYII